MFATCTKHVNQQRVGRQVLAKIGETMALEIKMLGT
jgi:hypothetical protein